ncbi:MAG TPA: pyrrolo-quinoline quinone [Candidatus Binatia bacterium]|nr:pyrrolo-quinoline quinone [Candidatus Binatia bacterium]
MPSTVNSAQFGRLFQYSVDGDVYAQPLYVPSLNIPTVGTRNVLFVATEHDSVYAFDADQSAGVSMPLWQTSFIDAAAGITTVPYTDVATTDIVPEIGITGTPVIDPTRGTLFVVAATKEQGAYVQRLHALDITTGREQPGSPVLIAPTFDGDGDDSNAGVVSFNALRESQRAGLLLSNGVVYAGWASHGDHPPYHGWIVGYDAETLQQVAVFNDTPDGADGGIWQAGGGLAADGTGDVFCVTGNGTFDADAGGRDFGESVLRLDAFGGLRAVDYFAPYNYVALNAGDLDLGSSGIVLLPDQPGSHPHLALAVGKQGTIYVVDRDNLGHLHSSDNGQIVESLLSAIGPAFGTGAYWNGTVYYAGVNDFPKAFALANGYLSTTPVSQAATKFGFPGASPSVSANGTSAGIVWLVQSDGYPSGPGILHAYDATDLSNELFHSSTSSGAGDAGRAIKFAVPTIVNGKVYVPGRSVVTVFGLTSAAATTTASPTPTATAPPTLTATIVFTPTPAPPRTGTRPADSTPTVIGVSPCIGDCDGNGIVSVDELVEAVNMALGLIPWDQCPSLDCDGGATISVACVVRAINNALSGCFSDVGVASARAETLGATPRRESR